MTELNLKRLLLRGGLWALLGKLLNAASAVLLSALLARRLAPEDLGEFFLIFNLAGFFAIFCRFGLDSTALRFVSEALERQDRVRIRQTVQKTVLLLLLLGSVLAALILRQPGQWFIANLLDAPALLSQRNAIVLWMLLLALQLTLAEIFRALHDIRLASLFGGLISTSLGLVLLIYDHSASLPRVVDCLLAAYAVNVSLSLLVLTCKLPAFPNPASIGNGVSYRELLAHAWPIFISVLTLFILNGADLWILSAYRPGEEVALYGAAARLVAFTAMPLHLVNAVIPPLISRLNIRGDQARLERLLRTTATLAAIPALAILGMLIIFGKPLLALLFGDFYSQAYSVLVILSLGQIASVLTGSCGFTLIMLGHQRMLFLHTFIAAFIGPLGGLYLIKDYGPAGVAFSFAAAMTVLQASMWFTARFKCGLWTHGSLSVVFNNMRLSAYTKKNVQL